MTIRLTICLVSLVLFNACNDTEPLYWDADASADTSTDASSTAPHELVGLDESCDSRLTGQDVLDAVRASNTAMFDYQLGGSTEITITFAYEGGVILCQPHIPITTDAGAPDAPASVSVTVAVMVSTADGAFDELGQTTLVQNEWASDPLGFAVTLPLETIAGTYTSSATDLVEQAIHFSGTADLERFDGMAVETGRVDEPGGATSRTEIGSWSSGS